ncbi:ade6, partial [Symbiodinium microadriaticum]
MELQEVPVAPFCEVVSVEDCLAAGRRFGYPFVLKNALLAYDGRGNVVVRSAEVIEECFTRLGGEGLYAEQFVPFAKELAVMVVRTRPEGGTEDDMMCFPLVETLQRDGICDTVVCPAQVPESVRESALAVARQAVGCLRGQGVFGVELFMLPDGQILYNEIAPRPHNSGHYTIESCEMDQFEMHLRAVASLPCPPPALRVPHALMVNIIGQ